MDDNALSDTKLEESGNKLMNNNTYSDEETGDTKAFPERKINDLNEYKNNENDL